MAQADLRRVVQATEDLKRARRARDEAIRAAYASHETYTDIGKAAGLSRQWIKQIVEAGPLEEEISQRSRR